MRSEKVMIFKCQNSDTVHWPPHPPKLPLVLTDTKPVTCTNPGLPFHHDFPVYWNSSRPYQGRDNYQQLIQKSLNILYYKIIHLVAYAIPSFDLLVLSKLAGCLRLICFVMLQSKHFSYCMRRRPGKMSLYLQFLKINKNKTLSP